MNTTRLKAQWAELDEIPSVESQCPTVYYAVTGGNYWITNSREDWIPINEASLKRLLKGHGISAKRAEGEPLSPLDQMLNRIQLESDVAHAGPLAGYEKGLIEVGGQKILVTSSPRIIEPKVGPHPQLQAILAGMFGDEQLLYFKGWVKVAYESLRSGLRRPGQALVLAGPRDSYKSLLQNLVTEILGGRCAKPYRYMSGGTDFNGDLFTAEHLMIEDEIASCDIRARRNFGARIKEFTVNEVQSCHPKNRQAFSLKPFWRVTISVNDEPENLLILPPFDDSVADKMLILKITRPALRTETFTTEDRRRFWRALVAELPAFLWELCQWEIPAEMRSGRFGVKHFHHPDVLQAIEDSSPETKLLALIDATFERVDGVLDRDKGFLGTAEELQLILCECYKFESQRLFTWPNAAGTYLSRLADKHPGRVEQKRTAEQRLWKITPLPKK